MTERYFDENLGLWITVCPPGQAEGANDISNWSINRMHNGYGWRKEVMNKALTAQKERKAWAKKMRRKRR